MSVLKEAPLHHIYTYIYIKCYSCDNRVLFGVVFCERYQRLVQCGIAVNERIMCKKETRNVVEFEWRSGLWNVDCGLW